MSSDTSLADLVEKFEELTRDETQASLERSLAKMKAALRALPPASSHDDSAMLKHLASLVWNKCLEWKTKGAALGEMNVRFRHFSCDCLSIAATEDPSDLKVQQELLNMYLRTGKLWSELKRFELSDKCWANAIECIETISNSMQELLEEDMQAFRIAAFSLWSWMLEEKVSKLSRLQLDNDSMVSLEKKAAGFISNESQQSYLAGQCSNIASQLMNEKDYPKAVDWLEESLRLFESIKDEVSLSERKVSMAQVLRMISSCKDSLGEIDYAVKAIEMAYSNCPTDQKTLEQYAKMSIQFRRFEKARELITELFHMDSSDPKSELVFLQNNLVGSKELYLEHLLQLSNSEFFDRFDTTTEILEDLINRHRGSEYGDRSLMLYMEHLTQSDLNLAVERLAKILEGPLQKSFKNETLSFVSGSIIQRATDGADTNPRGALKVVETLAQVLPKNLKDSQAKTLRLLSRIHFQLLSYQESLRCALDSRVMEPNSPKSQILLFLNYLHLSMEKEALESLSELVAMENADLNQTLMICTEQALKAKKANIAMRCIECLLNKSSDQGTLQDTPPGYIGGLIIALIKLAIPSTDRGIVRLFERLATLLTIRDPSNFFSDPLNEILWITHIAWNQAIDFKEKDDLESSLSLFMACNEWTKLLPDSASALETRVKCLYQVIEFSAKNHSAQDRAKEISEKINECRVLLKKLQGFRDRVEQRHPLAPVEDYPSLQKEAEKDDISILVDLLKTEFQLACRLQKGGIEHIAEQIAFLSIGEEEKINLFVDFALEAAKASRLHSTFSIKYLRLAMTMSLKERNFALWAAANRSLISILPDKESSMDNFQATLSLLKAIDSRGFPEIELQYLICTAYNNGIYYAHLSRYNDARRWMEMSMNLLPYSTCKDTYESDILEGYNSVLSKLSPAKDIMVQ